MRCWAPGWGDACRFRWSPFSCCNCAASSDKHQADAGMRVSQGWCCTSCRQGSKEGRKEQTILLVDICFMRAMFVFVCAHVGARSHTHSLCADMSYTSLAAHDAPWPWCSSLTRWLNSDTSRSSGSRTMQNVSMFAGLAHTHTHTHTHTVIHTHNFAERFFVKLCARPVDARHASAKRHVDAAAVSIKFMRGLTRVRLRHVGAGVQLRRPSGTSPSRTSLRTVARRETGRARATESGTGVAAQTYAVGRGTVGRNAPTRTHARAQQLPPTNPLPSRMMYTQGMI